MIPFSAPAAISVPLGLNRRDRIVLAAPVRDRNSAQEWVSHSLTKPLGAWLAAASSVPSGENATADIGSELPVRVVTNAYPVVLQTCTDLSTPAARRLPVGENARPVIGFPPDSWESTAAIARCATESQTVIIQSDPAVAISEPAGEYASACSPPTLPVMLGEGVPD